jgi:hypothetical protein
VCPGVNLARNSIVSRSLSICSYLPRRGNSHPINQNINAMNFIWGFDFSKVKDPITNQEKVYDLHDFARVSFCCIVIIYVALILSTQYVQGMLTSPNRFDCVITPRSAHHVEIIKQNYLHASSTFEPFEHGLSPEDRAFVSQTRDELMRC